MPPTDIDEEHLQELADYRAALAALMARCLERIRSMEVPDEVGPLQEWQAND
jgi:hypothetical protein